MTSHCRDGHPFSRLLWILLSIAAARAQSTSNSTANATVSCSNAYTFTSREMGSNIQSVLATLVDRGPAEGGFKSTSSGSLGDTAYGLLQCRGDLTSQQCSSCAQSAAAIVNSTCVRNSTKGGRVYLDLCFLRYEDHFFSSTLDIVSSLANCSSIPSNTSSGFQSNSKLLVDFLEARVPQSERKFVGAVAGIGSAAPAYGLGQCIPDLSAADCAACLAAASNVVASTCGGSGGVCYYASCTLFFQGSKFFQGIPENATLSSSSKGNKKLGLAIGLPVAGFTALLLGVLGFCFLKRNKRSFSPKEEQGRDEINELQLTLHRGPVTFSYDLLRRATDDFNDANKLGEGGFGSVYKGTFGDGTQVAIKKLSVSSQQGEQQFLNEVNVIGSVQHRNLVRLLGCCVEGAERVLVYEFLKNNSLEMVLQEDNRSNEDSLRLSCEMRYNILLGTARGLTYLHEDSQVRIVHRDIKPSNILLDEAFEAKIADFGLARLYGEDEATEIITTKVAGTYGYMSPEYAFHGHLSEKADVFSFGIVLLETLAGRKNRDVTLPGPEQYLLEWAWQLYSEGRVPDLLDRKLLRSTSNAEETKLVQAIHIALMCTQVAPQDRPSMSHVVAMLSGHSNVHVPLTATFDVRTINPAVRSKGGNSSSNSGASDPRTKGSKTFSTPPEPR